MDKKQFFIDDISINFNLRNVNKYKTAVYCIIKLGCTKIKFSLGVKVMVNHWSRKKQRAYISPNISELDNANNHIVNVKIKYVMRQYDKFIDYLCENPTDEKNAKRLITEYIGMSSKKVKKENALLILGNYIEKSTLSSGAKTQYKGDLKKLQTFIKETMNVYYIDFDSITLDLLESFRDFLFTEKIKHKITGEIVKPLDYTVKKRLTNILSVLKFAEQHNKIDIKGKNLRAVVKDWKVSDDNFQIALNEDEIQRIDNLELTNTQDIISRDLFRFQLEVGQRFGDINGLEVSKIHGNSINIFQDKGEKNVPAPLTDTAHRILKKYENKLPKKQRSKVNESLKTICKAAGLCETYDITEVRGNKKKYKYTAYKWQLVATHTARRTFVTTALGDGFDSSVLHKLTGHKSSSFERYNKVEGEKAVNMYLSHKENKQVSSIERPQQITIHQPQENSVQTTLINSLTDGHRVLAMLGVEDPYDIDNLDEIIRRICWKEHELINKYGVNGLTQGKIKEVFNKYAKTSDRRQGLHELLELMKSK